MPPPRQLALSSVERTVICDIAATRRWYGRTEAGISGVDRLSGATGALPTGLTLQARVTAHLPCLLFQPHPAVQHVHSN